MVGDEGNQYDTDANFHRILTYPRSSDWCQPRHVNNTSNDRVRAKRLQQEKKGNAAILTSFEIFPSRLSF